MCIGWVLLSAWLASSVSEQRVTCVNPVFSRPSLPFLQQQVACALLEGPTVTALLWKPWWVWLLGPEGRSVSLLVSGNMPWGPHGQPVQRGTSLGWGEFIYRLCSTREGWPHWTCGLVCIRRASHAAACPPSSSPVCIPCHTVGTCLCPLPVPAHLLKLSSSVTLTRIPSLLPGVRTGSCVSYAIGNAASRHCCAWLVLLLGVHTHAAPVSGTPLVCFHTCCAALVPGAPLVCFYPAGESCSPECSLPSLGTAVSCPSDLLCRDPGLILGAFLGHATCSWWMGCSVQG